MGQSKKRPCPVLGHDIPAAECAGNRLSRYACVESCAFNPFVPRNYGALLEMEDRVDEATLKRLGGSAVESGALADAVEAASRRHPMHGAHAAVLWHCFFARDAAGRTFGQRWEEAGFAGLNNDERVLLRGKMQMRVVLLEVHRVIDQQRFEAIDLLEETPAPRVFVDRGMAAVALRFSALLTWSYPLPHFWRLSGSGIDVAAMNLPFSPRETLEACVTHLGGPAGPEDRHRWLAANFARLDQALTATAHARRSAMFAGLDASSGSASYELLAPLRECLAALTSDPLVERDELRDDEREKGFAEALVWFESQREGEAVRPPVPGRRVLGRVLLGRKEARLEAFSNARMDELNHRFAARLGARVRFSKERRDDIAARLAAGSRPPNCRWCRRACSRNRPNSISPRRGWPRRRPAPRPTSTKPR